MSLESVLDLTHHAYRNGYGIGYFESWNIESLQGVIDAAEKTRSPLIIGFSGEFLSGRERRTEEELSWYAALGKAAAETAQVPCGLIFNECSDDRWVMKAIGLGFNLVMLADSRATFKDYTRRVSDIVKFAHANSVAVEAEIDELPYGGSADADKLPQPSSVKSHTEPIAVMERTEPGQLLEFVEATNVDLLAVSAGNVHVSLVGEFELDLERLSKLHECIPIPLVLHGGTGITAGALKAAVTMGVAKVNFGTYLKSHYLRAIRRALAHEDANPHNLLGIGSDDDLMVVGRQAVRDAVLDRIVHLGCCGRG